MTAEEFVRELQRLTPTAESYANRGLSEEYITSLVDGFNCPKKKNSSTYQDPLLILVDCYDMSKIPLGSIDLGTGVKETNDYYIVGELEVDWLVVSKRTGIVKIVEKIIFTDMWECAADSSKFLNALLEAKKFFMQNVLDDSLYYNKEATYAVAETCTELAGGERYSDFYKMFVGCW
ncbi:MAG: hypothetical protein ACKO96_13675 [Flammeovirgaceae bacterium]